jgi:hypothetical protein
MLHLYEKLSLLYMEMLRDLLIAIDIFLGNKDSTDRLIITWVSSPIVEILVGMAKQRVNELYEIQQYREKHTQLRPDFQL